MKIIYLQLYSMFHTPSLHSQVHFVFSAKRPLTVADDSNTTLFFSRLRGLISGQTVQLSVSPFVPHEKNVPIFSYMIYMYFWSLFICPSTVTFDLKHHIVTPFNDSRDISIFTYLSCFTRKLTSFFPQSVW